MRLLACTDSAAEARVAAVGAGAATTLGPLLTEAAHGLVHRMFEIADHDTPATPEGWAKVFDRAAALSPEASVALYTLGDADRLAAATAEVVDWLRTERLVGAGERVLEIGCGIGRFIGALASLTRLSVGVDISEAMSREAALRTRHLSAASILRTSGRDLAMFDDGAFDLVLAVDSWPYIVNVGLSAIMAGEAVRVLRPGGVFIVLNWSYRGDAAEDRAEASWLASRLGLTLDTGEAPALAHWNGVLFRFTRPATDL